jgi:multimeric flavodoxin WrbA
MKIVVLGGSPKGELSVTLQYVKYIEKKFPDHEFVYEHVTQSLRKLEKSEEEFNRVMNTVRSADLVVWAYPLYVFLVHGYYKRFIELIWERGAQDTFKGKHAALISTSIHFFDHTAMNYMRGICDDLEMRFTDSYSADMDDLMKETERQRLTAFAEHIFTAAAEGRPGLRAYAPIVHTGWDYLPGEVAERLDMKGQRTVIVTDTVSQENNAGKMVERFRKLTGADVIDISALDMKGGCTGCIQCGFDNLCMYGDRDDVEKTYRAIGEYDIIVFAGTIRDRYLSGRWKTFVDRRFFQTHQPLFSGRQMGYLISGPMSQLQNLREVLQANAQLDEANLAGIATDEFGTSAEVDGEMETLAARLADYSANRYLSPQTFLGIGGRKIFRDDVYGRLRGVFQGDHRYYKKKGAYDFPQKDYKTRISSVFMMLLTKIPSVKSNIRQNMRKYMITSHQKVLKDKNM